MDLEATNGTFLNDVRIDAARYCQLKKGDILKFGASTKEYVLLTANTTALN
jgi:smad nuclear-interacting protein 1